jgi:hypothetical protein
MKRCFVIMLIVSTCCSLNGQIVLSPDFEKAVFPKSSFKPSVAEFQRFPPTAFFFSQNFENQFFQPAHLPKAYCYADLAFFCKVEVRMEKSLRIPVKFRLGNVEYVDYLEGKRKSR